MGMGGGQFLNWWQNGGGQNSFNSWSQQQGQGNQPQGGAPPSGGTPAQPAASNPYNFGGFGGNAYSGMMNPFMPGMFPMNNYMTPQMSMYYGQSPVYSTYSNPYFQAGFGNGIQGLQAPGYQGGFENFYPYQFNGPSMGFI
jgi:hypothetical protein